MTEQDRDKTLPENAPAKHPTDEDDRKDEKDQDAAVDEASEQSMDGSDAPSW